MPSPTLDHDALDRYITGNYGEDQYDDELLFENGEEDATELTTDYPTLD